MNAVEIEEQVSELAAAPYDADEFSFAFLEAFGVKKVSLKRLRTKSANASDVAGGVLMRNNIHIAVCDAGATEAKLAKLRESPKTTKNKCKFIVATDGAYFEAEDIASGATVACDFADMVQHFGFFLPLAGISTVKQIADNPIDIRATGRLNKLYLALIEENEDWSTDAKRHDLNQFMARLIFCFFAEDTGIFHGDDLFTSTIEQMSEARSGNTHEVIEELFRAMDTPPEERKAAKIKSWADGFPYVNGGLFRDDIGCPRFSRIARTYLLHAGRLDWQQINPDIFGSMIQAVADEEERGSLGMHYTSVPNILKVLNPLFLDDLREQLEKAGESKTKLRALRKRLSTIRVFDPACGSGNFLVIAYREMREIERRVIVRLHGGDRDADIYDLAAWPGEESAVRLTQFYGIEIKDFASEIARLALLIAEFQCDVRMIGQSEARALVLPLKDTGRIVTSNALRIEWEQVCPPPHPANSVEEDLGGPTGRLALEKSTHPIWETYICGNPPYLGSTWQTTEQKSELNGIFARYTETWKSLDYVAGWFMKAVLYKEKEKCAFVTTNSICQGLQVAYFWPLAFMNEHEIVFAHPSFKWSNLANRNAGVIVSIVGISEKPPKDRMLFEEDDDGHASVKHVPYINAYLVPAKNIVIRQSTHPIHHAAKMDNGNKAVDGGHLTLDADEVEALNLSDDDRKRLLKPFKGALEAIRGTPRFCLWIEDEHVNRARALPAVQKRIHAVASMRAASSKKLTRDTAATPHAFQQIRQTGKETLTIVPRVSSEGRPYLPISYEAPGMILSDQAFAFFNAPLWCFAIAASKIHLRWIGTVCGKMKTDFRYSNTLGWNTFPVPSLTEQNKLDLTSCAENILLARETHFPATIADLYDPDRMPDNLRAAHDKNDETLERIYIGRRFKNDTERLEKLFEMYTKMTAKDAA